MTLVLSTTYTGRPAGAKVFVTCNEITRLSKPLRSQFRCLHLPPYTEEQFLEGCTKTKEANITTRKFGNSATLIKSKSILLALVSLTTLTMNTAGSFLHIVLAGPLHCDIQGWPSCYHIGYQHGLANPGTNCPSGDKFCAGWEDGTSSLGHIQNSNNSDPGLTTVHSAVWEYGYKNVVCEFGNAAGYDWSKVSGLNELAVSAIA